MVPGFLVLGFLVPGFLVPRFLVDEDSSSIFSPEPLVLSSGSEPGDQSSLCWAFRRSSAEEVLIRMRTRQTQNSLMARFW